MNAMVLRQIADVGKGPLELEDANAALQALKAGTIWGASVLKVV